MDKKCLQMIKEMTEAFGPSGFEDDAVEVVKKYTKDLGDGWRDSVMNYFVPARGNTGSKPVFMFDAHNDEVGFMVHSIKPNGMLRIIQLGGWNAGSLVSNKVRVRNAEGEYIPGIIASKPVHFMTEAEKAKGAGSDIASLIVDVGSTSYEETVKVFKIRIGEPICPETFFEYDEKRDVMFGKAFDDRIGGAVMIEAMNRLAEEKLSVDLVSVFSSQEEIGSRGAQVAVNAVRPDIAICFEGCPADDTFTEPYAIQTALKKGPMLRFIDKSCLTNPRFQRFALDLAAEKGIPVQASVREGGGTNARMTTYNYQGIPTIVIGVPVRYTHSQNCIMSYFDFEASVQLAVEIVKAMDKETIAKF